MHASLRTESSTHPAALRTAIVIGARGGLGNAVMKQLLAREDFDRVYAVTRNTDKIDKHPNLYWLKSDSSEESIKRIIARLHEESLDLSRIFIATGTLHDQRAGRMPEKKIEDLELKHLEEVFHINTHVPMLWLQSLSGLLSRNSQTRVAVFSARVGSIGDNRLGGWYSYRSSKAALNMLLKTLAIEFNRRFPGVKLLSFHPGTTDTSLSKPFQKGVPESKLFSPDYVATRLLEISDELESDGTLSFLDWDNKPVPW
jgi:NAD(P)-dependent dehydrogenase (short-subunit alcohol dehydrogenase family)